MEDEVGGDARGCVAPVALTKTEVGLEVHSGSDHRRETWDIAASPCFYADVHSLLHARISPVCAFLGLQEQDQQQQSAKKSAFFVWPYRA